MLRALTEIVRRSRKDGVLVLLADLHAQPMVVLTNSGLLEEIGEHDAARTLDEAIEDARAFLGMQSAGEAEGRKQKADSRQQ